MQESEIKIVDDNPCPVCGAYWGNPDPNLDYPNRAKVGMDDGWWWKCYNPDCPVNYYNPKNGKTELR